MIEIIEVKTGKERKEFVSFVCDLYRDEPKYMPAVFSDALASMTPEKNKAFNFCEARFWLAKRDGKTVGRIGAIINHRANEKWNKNQMRFWQVDFIDDAEVSSALFEVVENWAKEKGCTEIAGPLGFTDLDLEGMLTDGFDERGIFVTYYNHPYYLTHLDNLGYEKDVDWVEYQIKCPEKKEDYARLTHMSDHCLKKFNLHLREVKTSKDIDRVAVDVMKMINTAYKDLYETSELDEEQQAAYVKSFKPVIDKRTIVALYDENENMVGFTVAISDISKALKRCDGKLFPFGWIGLLKALKRNDEYIGLLIGIHPEYRNKGAVTILMNGLLDGFVAAGAKTARMCPMLEDNIKVMGLMKVVDSWIYKRRRSFIKHL